MKNANNENKFLFMVEFFKDNINWSDLLEEKQYLKKLLDIVKTV